MATASISSTMGRAVRARLPERKMTWKKMTGQQANNSALIIKLDTLIVLD